MLKKTLAAAAVIAALLAVLLTGTGLSRIDPGSAHIDRGGTVYGTKAYLGSTLTLSGTGMKKEKTVTVEDIEKTAYCGSAGYQGMYSLMTSGGIFSKHKYAGVELFSYLENEGMKSGLPDKTKVTVVSKDGYTVELTLGELRGKDREYYSSKESKSPAEKSVPVILAFASDGYPLVGPTGSTPMWHKMTAKEGYDKIADNVGGPLRLIIGQKDVRDYNAPDDAKWVTDIIIGEETGVVADGSASSGKKGKTESETSITAGTSEKAGTWKHDKKPYSEHLSDTLVIDGSEADRTVYTLKEIESLGEGYCVRGTYAASGGRYEFQGVVLRKLIDKSLKAGIGKPSKITVVGNDGFSRTLSVKAVYGTIVSSYQKDQRREVILAYSADGAPLVPSKNSAGYTGSNAYGPMRIVVENQISGWIKNVKEIKLGE